MKIKNLIYFILLTLVISSCKKEEEQPNYSKEAEGIFIGVFNYGTFQSADYKITIKALIDNNIKVTPEDNNGVEFEEKITKADGIIISYDNKLNISNTTGIDRLRFNVNGQSFDGYRQ